MTPEQASLEWSTAVDRFAADMAPSFTPHAYFSEDRGTLHVFTHDAPSFRVRVHGNLTIMVSALDQRSFVGMVVDNAWRFFADHGRHHAVSMKSVIERFVAEVPEVWWHLDPEQLSRVACQEVRLR